MEIDKLNGFVLLIVLVGMILGVGILVLDSFGTATKDSTSVINESQAFVAGAGALDNDDVSAVTEISNGSVSCIVFNTATSCANYTSAGAITLGIANFTDLTDDYNVTYTYDKDSTTTTTMASMVTGVSPIATTWLPLIITIAVLSIILVLVIRSFNVKR